MQLKMALLRLDKPQNMEELLLSSFMMTPRSEFSGIRLKQL